LETVGSGMSDKYTGYEKVIKDALVEGRGHKSQSKIEELEKKLESAKLTHTEVAEIHKQLRHLKKN
jgi:hypothetical protein